MRAEKIYANKLLGYVYFSLDYDPNLVNEKTFVTKSVSNLYKTTIGFAGFKNKKSLKQYLQSHVFDNKKQNILPKYDFDKNKILRIIENTLSLCHKELPSKPTRVFLFPSFDSFVKDRMGGVGGFSPWKNTILITINPTVRSWETALKNTIAHEYNHSVIYNTHKWETLLDSLVFEGFAEHFREQVVSGKIAPRSEAVSDKECKNYLSILKKQLHSKSHQLYREVFFGGEKYPHRLGYSLGYNIVQSFLTKTKKTSWIDIIKTKPTEILKQFDF